MRAHRRQSNAQRFGGLRRGKALGEMNDDLPLSGRQVVALAKRRTELFRILRRTV